MNLAQVEQVESQEAMEAGGMKYAFPASLSIESIEQVAQEMREKQLDKQALVLADFDQVENLLTPAVQLLVSLEKALAEHGGKLMVINIKPGVQKILSDMGFDRFLMQPKTAM